MLVAITLLWVLNQLSAPTWCYVLTWITIILDIIQCLMNIYNAGANNG